MVIRYKYYINNEFTEVDNHVWRCKSLSLFLNTLKYLKIKGVCYYSLLSNGLEKIDVYRYKETI